MIINPKRLQNVYKINLRHRHVSLISAFVAVIVLHQVYRVSGIECGKVNIIHDLIRRGNAAVKGAWPFIVVLYRGSDSQPFCSGTLISKKHVLTGNNEVVVLLPKSK